MNTATVRREIETFIERNPGRAGLGASMLRILDAGERDRRKIAALRTERDEALRANEWREVQVKRLRMAVQFELNSLPTMREETRAAGLASVADQIERNREGLERIVKSVEALDDIAAAPPPASEDAPHPTPP